MKVEYLSPESLIPYEKNAKDHPPEQIKVLAASIEHFGFDQPIVVDQNKTIIKGHGRRLAAIELGMEKVPVVIRQIGENEAKYLRVSDNEVSKSRWDTAALKVELKYLDIGTMNLDITGFTLDERITLLADLPLPKTFDIEVGGVNPTHECIQCSYRW